MKNKSSLHNERIPSSFRDPSGFLFYKNKTLYRQINLSYKRQYDHLVSSGLLKLLIEKKLLVPHRESAPEKKFSVGAYKIIQPELIHFVSYPYEWCFSQLKDAAMATLQIQKYALEHGMVLKDASSYNIQFVKGRPTLIDTLSFEIYKEGEPWIAYRQFCQHFLATLALMRYCDARLAQLLRIYVDGVPLDLAGSLLPLRSLLNLSLFAHIRLHANIQKHAAKKHTDRPKIFLSKKGLRALVDNLESLIESLKWEPKGTEWGDYYSKTNYSPEAFASKKKIVEMFLKSSDPKQVWDMGGNVGVWSRIASAQGIETICFDVDPAAVEKNYLKVRTDQEKNLLPLVLDLTNPSPALGWANRERSSLQERGPSDMVFALALVHHLAITANIPFESIAEFFSTIGKSLIVEFIPKEDSQLRRMLALSMKVFPDYTQKHFESAFQKYFLMKTVKRIQDSARILYFMQKR